MNLGALYGFYKDMKERRDTVRRIQEPDMGFAEGPGGVWTWTFTQNELTRAVERPTGSAVEIAGVLGFPFIRLRAALPEELFDGSIAQCLGRQAGLSVAALADAREDNLNVVQRLKEGMSCFSCGPASQQIPELDLDADGDPKQSREGKPVYVPPRAVSLLALRSPSPTSSCAGLADYDCGITTAGELDAATSTPSPATLVGTAIIFAYMTNAKTLPVVELAKRRDAASKYFKGVQVPGIDHDFDELCSKVRGLADSSQYCMQTLLGVNACRLTGAARPPSHSSW